MLWMECRRLVLTRASFSTYGITDVTIIDYTTGILSISKNKPIKARYEPNSSFRCFQSLARMLP
jgi:hypothetical protein